MPDKDDIRFYHGHSMWGTFRPGDCLSVVPVPLSDVRPGDVVVYRGPNHRAETGELVHRIVAVGPGGLVAQGDNNPCADTTLVTAGNLLGRVTHVERNGRTRLVRGGLLGLLRVRVLRARCSIWRLITRVGRGPYRWLRESGLIARLWQPSLLKMRLVTENGPLVKYVCGGRTVARWWPAEGRFECRRPYDLVLRREHLLAECDVDVQCAPLPPSDPVCVNEQPRQVNA